MGQDGVDFLRGKLGDSDVKDMQEAVLQTLDSFPHLDSKNIYLYGKSYGGYLVGQLSANFPVIREFVLIISPNHLNKFLN